MAIPPSGDHEDEFRVESAWTTKVISNDSTLELHDYRPGRHKGSQRRPQLHRGVGLAQFAGESVYLRVSQINGCAYCIDMHSRDLIKEGFAIEKLVLVQAWREAGGLFDARERAALAWAETVTRVADTAVPDDEFMAASAVFSEKELADLTIAIGLMNAYNRLAIGFRNTPSAVRNVDAARCAEQE